MLRADGIRVAFPGRPLVEGLTLELAAGETWAILGRNGSGKSTLLQLLGGLDAPKQGKVLLDGAPMQSVPRRELGRKIGLLLQEETGAFWGSTRDYVLLGRHPHARSAFGWTREDEDIAAAELERQNLGPFAGRAFATLSGGERQRARAAALFAQRPHAYLLDEPLQNLDLPHQAALLDRLAQEARAGALVVMVLHDLLFASRYCNRFLLLQGDGRYAAGTADQVLNAGRLGELYGFHLEAVETRGERLFLPARTPHV